MRNNGPVTQREFIIDDGATLVSTTDLKSRITYCNPAFVAVSGYERDDMSVRTKPARAEVGAAEQLYAAMRQEAARGALATTLRAGEVMRRGAGARLGRLLRPGLGVRIAGAAAVAPLAAALAAEVLPAAVSLALSLVLGAVSAWWLRRMAIGPLLAAAETANRMAAGDLTQSLASDRHDEAGRLARGLTQLNVNLQAIVGDVRRTAARTATTTGCVPTSLRCWRTAP